MEKKDVDYSAEFYKRIDDKIWTFGNDEVVLSKESKRYFVGRGTEGSVGYDIKAKDYKIDWRRNSVVYFTGIRAIVKGFGYYLEVVPRSSIYKKRHIGCMANSFGVIDKDYTGEILVIFRLQFRSWFERMWYRLGFGKLDIYDIGDRVAQMIIRRFYVVKEVKYDSLDSMRDYIKAIYGDKRLDNGFGSTGK